MAGSWSNLLAHVVAGGDLSAEDTAWAMDLVMTGEATPARVAAFVVGLRAKGETPEEIRGMADAMLAHARAVDHTARSLDVVGTGGDRSGSVNISTMAAIVAAACGATVVKHGNRAASSKCGTADVLEALGIAIDLPPAPLQRCVEEIGLGFCYAPVFHPAMKYAAAPRREIGIPTAFNLLGPLTNPARPSSGLIGCADRVMAPVLADVFATRGNSTLVVSGDDGMDEVTTTAATAVWVVHDGKVTTSRIDPTAFGLPLTTADDLRGGDAAVNAEVVHALLAGRTGPVRDAVLLNTAAALAAHDGPEPDLHGQLDNGMSRAARALDSGKAAALLQHWAERSTTLKAESD
ncbi:anthranilate phosphoribosyltransferase [Allosaccharopolyspora coralli]|uniref:Anthranilate phosphoribosyltransferase n=1 Tax=Allosaccharopolyspora coralli TaxID=2665642 RepID=A0A5Q3QCY6_9PSEU|nr:anthranilate phosphoribosyltransferase [Allosaccharopolyspora coralli]QGK69409.1 anthranilate phosphoribosyltransferase [Allosaccharopolyspora coralli]